MTGAEEGPTLNKECNRGSPRASRDSYNKPIPLPNGNSGCPISFVEAAIVEDVHAKDDQQRRGSEG
jgi:hypothetical protein